MISLLYLTEVAIVLIFDDSVETHLRKNPSHVPSASSYIFRSYDPEVAPLIPLAGVSKVNTVLCNEDGSPLVEMSDRYGFINQDKKWDQQSYDMVIAGESYFQGFCTTPYSEHFIAKLNREFNILNLSNWGNGPLAKLGVLKEYFSNKWAKKLIFSFAANDLVTDLSREKKSILSNYLHPSFSQDLMSKQSQVNTFISKNYGMEQVKKKSFNKTYRDFRSMLRLENVSKRFFSWLRELSHPRQVAFKKMTDYHSLLDVDLKLYSQILDEVVKIATNSGATPYFIYIPLAETFIKPIDDKQYQKNIKILHREVISLAKEKGFHIIDLHSYISKQKNPLRYYNVLRFPYNYGHFKRDKHSEVFKFIMEQVSIGEF